MQPTGEFPQPNWLERRVDRLETWNRRHGYPIEKARDTTKTVVVCSLVVAGTAAGFLAYLILKSELDKLAQPNVPSNNPGSSVGN